MSAAKKTKEDVRHTSVLFAGTVKLPNSAFCISKVTKLISTKFAYFLPYIYTTSHIEIEGNRFSSSRDVVQLECNFTHAWWSTHGYTQIFMCKIQKVAMEIFIFMRRGVA